MTDNFPFPVSNEGATSPCELRDSEHSCRLPVSLRQVLKRLQSWVACKTWAPNGTPYPRSVQGERHVKCCSVQWHKCSANRFTPAQLVTWVKPLLFFLFFSRWWVTVGFCAPQSVSVFPFFFLLVLWGPLICRWALTGGGLSRWRASVFIMDDCDLGDHHHKINDDLRAYSRLMKC
jgi:hypothetical protein